jgi:hypothetical protein
MAGYGRGRPRSWQPFFAALFVLWFSAVHLPACSVPVFRYALEKWPPDHYEAVLFHRGPLSAAQQALTRSLSPDDLSPGHARANVTLQTVDLAGDPAPELLTLWQSIDTNALPWLVVRYPANARLPGHVHSAPFTEATLPSALVSPARTELVRRLGRGDSGVWLLLETGDRQRDDAAARLIESRLAYLTSVIKLPAIDPQDIASGLVTLPAGGLRLAFSVLRVSRSGPAEATLVKTLLGSESDLAGVNEPILFPVFGRGRALYAIVGQGINHETIDEAATFLTGRCSCQVKELNPGVDLLLTADWDSFIPRRTEPKSAPVPPTEAPETVTITGTPETPAPTHARPADSNTSKLLLGGCLILGLLGAALWWRRS